jgi:6-phosphofructokinase 1
VVESIGKSCGYQSLYGAICSGSDAVFVPEVPLKLEDMNELVKLMRHRFTATTSQIGLILNSETASEVYDTSFMKDLLQKELKDLKVSAREAILSGLQQGGDPSPMDRIFSGRLALAAVDSISKAFSENTVVNVCVGLIGDERVITELSQFEKLVDHTARRPQYEPWLPYLKHVFEAVSYPDKIKARI